MNSDKSFDENTFAPGTLVRWRVDGEIGFVVECWRVPSELHNTLSIRFCWLSSHETVEMFDDIDDANRCFIVISEPTHSRVISSCIERD